MSIRESAIPVTLPPMGAISPEVAARRSLTHWVWTPYKDIHNMMPWGLKTQLGYRDLRWTVLKRCTPYPLSNLTHQEADREAAAEFHAQGITNTAIPPKEFTKYAQAQANELGESYSDSGLRVLVPLLGMDDGEIVKQIIQVVQPFTYDIHEMREEFTRGAARRIEESNLSETHKDIAYRTAEIMLHGANDAEKAATREYNALIKSMNEAQLGKPGVVEPDADHEWICHQLNKPVPKRIDKTGGDGGESATVLKVLLDRDSKRERELAELKAQIAAAQAEKIAPAVEPETAPPTPLRHDGKLLARK